jgi:competence protein ComEC
MARARIPAVTILILAAGWVSGLLAVGLWDAPWWLPGLWWLAIVPLVAALRLRSPTVVILAAAFAMAAALRSQAATDYAVLPPELAGAEATLSGTVGSEGKPGTGIALYDVHVESVVLRGADAPMRFRVRVAVSEYITWLPGDRVSIAGRLAVPTEDLDGFDLRRAYAREGIVATIFNPRILSHEAGAASLDRYAARARNRLDMVFQRALREPEASLAAGILYGRDEGLGRDLRDDFRASGLAHLTAVSGTNVALLAAAVYWLTIPLLGRYRAGIPVAVVLGGYLIIAGLEPSIVRASILASAYLVGAWLGRPQSGLPALAVAVVGMTALSPTLATDAGFQLSVAATAGLITFQPWIDHALLRGLGTIRCEALIPAPLRFAASATLAASVATLPVTAYTFGTVSPGGIVANVAAAPLFVLAFGGAGLVGLAGLVSGDAAWALGLVVFYPLTLIVELAMAVATLSGARLSLPALSGEVATVIGLGLAGVGLAAYLHAPGHVPKALQGRLFRMTRLALATAVAMAVVVLMVRWSVLPMLGPRELVIHVLDVGQGDAVLVRGPGGESVLIDGGPGGLLLARQLGEVLPHWERMLDLVVLTHPQSDHVGGLAHVLRRYRVDGVADAGDSSRSASFEAYRARATSRRQLSVGDRFRVGELAFSVLWPPAGYTPADLNNRSIVLLLEFRGMRILLTGDVEGEAQRALLADGLAAVDILKVPHHGSSTNTAAFLARTAPALALISVGEGNRFGHPAPDTLTRLGTATILRTDSDGRITVRIDGAGLRWSTER